MSNLKIPFESIIDNTNDLYWTVDENYSLVYGNKAFLHLMKTLTGQNIKPGNRLINEDQWKSFQDSWRSYYEKAFSGVMQEAQDQYIDPVTGERFYVQVRFCPIPDTNGAIHQVVCHCTDITKQKLKEEELLKMMDASLDVICTIDAEGNFVKVSGASALVWGYEPEELEGKPYMDLVFKDDIPKTEIAAQSIMSGVDTTTFENRYRKKDGSLVSIAWSARWDSTSQIMYCVARNATEKNRIPEAEKAIENRYKALIQNGSDLISVLDLAGNYQFVSSNSIAILGLSPEEFIGKNAFDFVHPEDKEWVFERFGQIATQNEVKIDPFRFKNHKGDWRWMETFATNMLNNPEIMGIVTNSRDVTERVEQENILKKSQEQYQLLFNRSPLPKWIYDLETYKILDVNETAVRHYGYSASEFLSMEFFDLLPPGEKTEFEKKMPIQDEVPGSVSFGISIHQKKDGHAIKMDIYGHAVTFLGKAAMMVVGHDVTERENLIEALNYSETKLKTASSIARLGYWKLALDGQELQWSDNVYEIWERKRETFSLNFESFFETIHPDDQASFQKAQDAAYTGVQELNHEHRILLPNGSIRWVHELGRLVYDSNGQPVAFEGTVQNITEKKNAALQLLKNEKRYRILIENGADAVVILGADGSPTYASPSITKLLGYSEEEALQLNLFDIIHPKDREGVVKKMEEVLSNPGIPIKGYTSRTKHKDGRWRWLEATITNMLHDPEIQGIVDNFRDITERKEEEQHLKLLESVVTNTNDAVLITEAEPLDEPGPKIMYVNDAFTRMTGYTAEEVIGKTPRMLQGPGSDTAELKKLSKALRNWEPCEITTINYKKNGDAFLINFSVSPVADENGWFTHWIAIERDVTEQRKTEQLLKDATQLARVGSWEVSVAQNKIAWSDITYEIHEILPGKILNLENAIHYYRPDFQDLVRKNVNQCLATGKQMDFEAVLITQTNKERWVRVAGEAEFVNGKCLRIFGSIQDIHNRKIMELQMTEILTSISDAFYAVDQEWNFTYFNKESENLLNKKAEDVLGNNIWEVFPAAIGTELESIYKQVVQQGRPQSFEYYFPGDGSWYEVNSYPSQGGVSAYFKNIDDRKRAAEDLLKAYEEKNRILESIGDAFFTMDRNFIVSYWNKVAEELMEMPREAIIGKNLFEVFPDAVELPSHGQYLHVIETGEAVTFEDYYGAWFEVNVHPTEEGLSVFFRDITLRKETDLRIQRANERFEKVAEATNDSVWDWDIVNAVFYRSKHFSELFGYHIPSIIKENAFWQDRFHPEDVSAIKASLEAALSDKDCTKWEQEYRIFHSNGAIKTLFDRGIIIRDSSGKATRMVGAVSDISYRKNHEKDLLALNNSLKKYANELEISNEQLEQFAFIASHDLQEPLRMISSFLNQLERKYKDKLDEKAIKYIHFAVDGAKRMKQIILDLLEYSRAGKLQDQKESLDLTIILEEYGLLRRKMIEEKKAIIEMNPMPLMDGYKTPFIQTMHCLLDNALKYSKKGNPPEIKITLSDEADKWLIGIHDNGIGIDPEFFDKIFIIFQRLHNREDYQGTGIGLPIAKKNIEAWGGRIWLESDTEKGSSFYFTVNKG